MLLKNAKIINPKENKEFFADVRIKNELISEIKQNILPQKNEEIIDLTGKYIAPALIDMHCHLREPGFTHKETIETGINSAINGGYSAICPMANTNPIVDNLETLNFIKEKAKQAKEIDFLPICAVSENFKEEKIVDVKTLKENGAIAFSNDGKPIENMDFLYKAIQEVTKQGGLIISHSEDFSLSKGGSLSDCEISKKLGIKGIPDTAEANAVDRELKVVKELNAKYHLAHISTKRSIDIIRKAKKEGINITCETAPHYFSLTQDDITEPIAKYKVNPPLRTEEDRLAVIEALKDGTIDVIATDHAPHSEEEKNQQIDKAPMGMAGFETSLALTLTYLVNSGEMSLIEALKKLTCNPAKILNLENQGIIEVNKKANLVVFDLEKEWIVDAKKFKSKCKFSPYDGKTLKGKPIMTIINGKINNIE